MVLDLVFLHFFHVQVLIGVKMCIIFGVDNSSSVHKDNKKKCILVLVKIQNKTKMIPQ